jgi:hypothetical protein
MQNLALFFFHSCQLEGVQDVEIGLGNCKHIGI